MPKIPVLLLPVTAVLLGLIGCAGPTNPSFTVDRQDAREAIRDMRARPVEPVRPIVVVGPFLDPAIAEWQMRHQVRQAFEPDRVVGVSFPFWSNFDLCREQVIEAVEAEFPSDDPDWTTEVDVIAFSMGGLVARYAATPPTPPTQTTAAQADHSPRKQLKIARLYTVCSPHQGSALARLPSLLPLVRSMAPDSPFLTELNSQFEDAPYTLTAYTRLTDPIVDPTRAAPEGHPVRWVQPPPFTLAHNYALDDPRLIADILRRLRNETPLSTDPPAPLPG
ncbi:MAG: hypothetical protein AAGI68_05055 [Planctomycetota bacterium]